MAKSHNTYSTDKRHSSTIRTVFMLAIEHIRQNPHVLDVIHKRQSIQHKAEPNSNVEYTVPTAMYARIFSQDRTFPLDTVQIKTQELKREKDIGEAIIHIGAAADEYARSTYTLAFTIANHIYFRNGAYKPETEEGRVLLAHELPHVAQYKNKPLADNRTHAELETEAELAEQTEIYDSDPLITIRTKRNSYHIRKSKEKKLCQIARRELESWIEQQKYILPEQKYLELLCNYDKYLEECKWQQMI